MCTRIRENTVRETDRLNTVWYVCMCMYHVSVCVCVCLYVAALTWNRVKRCVKTGNREAKIKTGERECAECVQEYVKKTVWKKNSLKKVG